MVIYDPILKLELYKKYISYFIGRRAEDKGAITFHQWLWSNKGYAIVGHVDYFKAIATNCFYCQKEFGEKNTKFGATVDHFYPQSKDFKLAKEWDIFVVCCYRCNQHKGCQHPADFIKKFTVLNMTGGSLNNISKKDIKRISDNVNKIFNDILRGCSKKVYYKQRNKNKFPKEYWVYN